MWRSSGFLALLLVLSPLPAFAIQLHWSSGADTLTFAEATRCVLVLSAESNETLPAEWRLLWVADSAGIHLVNQDSLAYCASDTAMMSVLTAPGTPADSAAHLVTAQFCSDEGSTAAAAYYLLDQPGGSQGRLKVVALDPDDPDSMTVIESNEVTYNGGVDGEYAPVLLHASSIHQTLRLRVTAVGSGLAKATSFTVMATDSTWSLALEVGSKSNTSIVGTASVAALLPACRASIDGLDGVLSITPLTADTEPMAESITNCQAEFTENLLPTPPGQVRAIQPKDFAFAKGFVDETSNKFALHLFYIRHSYYNITGNANEKNIGHIWTTDFNSWYGPAGQDQPDTVALTVRSGKFDELHVWAPTIVQRGPTFWMFYTGVRTEEVTPGVFAQHQRIGVATSSDLITWTPSDAVVLSAPQIPWAKKDASGSPFFGAQQLRDPYVMEDPINPGQWLMYFVAEDSVHAPRMAVGVARSTDLLNWTPQPDPYIGTEQSTFQGSTFVVESPHVFQRGNNWWMLYSVNRDQVFLETSGETDPSVVADASWSDPVWLRGVTEERPWQLQYWHATEHLRINSTEYLAAFDDSLASIDIRGIYQPSVPESAAVDSFALSCPQVAAVAEPKIQASGVRLSITKLGWGDFRVGLRMELPSRMRINLAVFDIAGRRRTTLLDHDVAAGVTDITWDGGDSTGRRMESGVYFLRLSYANGARTSKIVILR